MAVRTAYGERDRLPQAIGTGVIPKGTVIFTKEEGDQAELLFYDPQGNLKPVKEKSIFFSPEEAHNWTKKYGYTGQTVSVLEEDGAFHLYLVEPGGEFVPTESLLYVQEYGYSGEFPNIGRARCIYIATKENDGKGYLYRWSETGRKYYKPFDSFEDIKVISGGSAND